MDLLFVTGSHASFHFVWCTKVAVNFLTDQDRLDCCISKDDSGCEQAVDHSDYDLPWLKREVSKFLEMEEMGKFLQTLLA
jgi:hypothetical protein